MSASGAALGLLGNYLSDQRRRSAYEANLQSKLDYQKQLQGQQTRQNLSHLQDLGIDPATGGFPLQSPGLSMPAPNTQYQGNSQFTPLESLYARLGANSNISGSVYPSLVSGSLSNAGALQRHLTPNATNLATQLPYSNVFRDEQNKPFGIPTGENRFEAIPTGQGFNPTERYHSPGTTVNVGGSSTYKIPAGFMLADPSNYAQGVVPIPGGPKQRLSPEQAAKFASTQEGVKTLKSIKNYLIDKNGNIDRAALAQMNFNAPFTRGRTANAQYKDVVEAKLRAESGAAVPPDEVERMAERFRPSLFDRDDTIKDKLRRFESWLGEVNTIIDPTNSLGRPRKTPQQKKAIDDAFKDLGIP